MKFDYERETRAYYQNDQVAEQYHSAFTADYGLKSLPFKLVARRERRTIETLLAAIPHDAVLDIPAGTGKLAEVFARFGSRVVASDVSGNMLDIARQEYRRIGYAKADFVVADATDLGRFASGAFDAVVCLRLMHRVPSEVRRKMLSEFARVAPWLVISFGIENAYHTLRQSIRNRMFGGGSDAMCFCSLASARREIEPLFEIRQQVWIAPALSREMIFLLESKIAA